jgi:uncharacterized protein (DUF433 family)
VAQAAATDPALNVDTEGVVRVGRTRVTLRSVVVAFQQGATAEEIALQYPVLDLVDVYAAITYYLRNRSRVEDKLAEEDRESEEILRLLEAQSPTADLRRRLRAKLTVR